MNRPMQPLHDEHAELLPRIDELPLLADLADEVTPEELGERFAAVSTFLRDQLLVHARAEEAALYPMVERVMAAPGATATMSRDHVEIGRLIGELAEIPLGARHEPAGADALRQLRRLLYGLYAVVTLHFAKEEEIYLPLLDEHLTAEAAAGLFEAMEAAVRAAPAAA